MAYEFILGVDVATDGDDALAATLAIVEKESDGSGEASDYRMSLLNEESDFDDAESVAERIQTLLTQKPYVARTVPVVNRTTEHGEALQRALEDRGLDPVGITLSAGTGTVSGNRNEMNANVALQQAIDTLTTLYHGGHLDLLPQEESKEVSQLVHSIERFGTTGSDEDQTDRREEMAVTPDGDPYDAVLVSAALACWLGEEQTFDPTERLKERPRGIGQPGR